MCHDSPFECARLFSPNLSQIRNTVWCRSSHSRLLRPRLPRRLPRHFPSPVPSAPARSLWRPNPSLSGQLHPHALTKGVEPGKRTSLMKLSVLPCGFASQDVASPPPPAPTVTVPASPSPPPPLAVRVAALPGAPTVPAPAAPTKKPAATTAPAPTTAGGRRYRRRSAA